MSTSSLAIRALDPTVTIFSRPFRRAGVAEIGGRMSVVRMQDGGLWVFAPTALDAETSDRLRGLGDRVNYVVCPDIEHHLYASDYQKRWPDAKVIGVEGLPEKRKDISFFAAFERRKEMRTVGYEDEFDHVYFSGHANRDVAFFHRPTRTLFQADLLFNLPPTEQYPDVKHWGYGQQILHKLFNAESTAQKFFIRYALSKDTAAMKEDAARVANWDIQRIVPCHGDVIENNGKKIWRDAYSWLLN